MWVVADLDDDYIRKMGDVLEVYERPYDPQQPVVCLDEKPITLHADVRPGSPSAPGREARQDNEYKRCGTANVFCALPTCPVGQVRNANRAALPVRLPIGARCSLPFASLSHSAGIVHDKPVDTGPSCAFASHHAGLGRANPDWTVVISEDHDAGGPRRR